MGAQRRSEKGCTRLNLGAIWLGKTHQTFKSPKRSGSYTGGVVACCERRVIREPSPCLFACESVPVSTARRICRMVEIAVRRAGLGFPAPAGALADSNLWNLRKRKGRLALLGCEKTSRSPRPVQSTARMQGGPTTHAIASKFETTKMMVSELGENTNINILKLCLDSKKFEHSLALSSG